VAGRVCSILTLNLTGINGIGRMFGGRFRVFRTATRRHMASVSSFCAFANLDAVPRVVPVDLQQDYLARRQLLALSKTDAALANCRKVLDHARRIEGSEPCRNEMIFERTGPSCYSCEPFAALMEQSRGGIVMARFAGGSSCQSTLVDAFHRKHKVTYLSDACASHAPDDMAASDVHRAVSTISGFYAKMHETDEWIAVTTPRRLGNDNLGNGMSAGGV
jgi:hypothetical protein